MMTATATTARSRDMATSPHMLPSLAPKAARRMRMGTTARSWNSSTAKLARPCAAPISPRSFSNCMTIAVEESAKHRPMMMDASRVLSQAKATAPTSMVVTNTCAVPRPKIKPLKALRRSNDNSRPTGAVSRAAGVEHGNNYDRLLRDVRSPATFSGRARRPPDPSRAGSSTIAPRAPLRGSAGYAQANRLRPRPRGRPGQ